MKNDFRSRLDADSTVLFDGAMGTMLYQRGVFLNRCFEEVSLSDPRLVLEIHREYLDAGADVLTTNSWGAGMPKLRAAGLEEKFAAINERAVKLARQAIEESPRSAAVWVAGSIGPLGVNVEPLGTMSAAEAEDLFQKQAAALASAGADLLILETFVDLRELAAAVRGARRACDLPLIASLTITNEGTSVYGSDPEIFTARIDELAPDAIGLNCSEGPRVMLETAEKMVRVTNRPLCVQPNAGVPLNVNGRNIYPTTPAYMAKYAKRMIQSGVRIVGGCCGTTPLHIREIRNEIRALQPSIPQERIRVVVPAAGKEAVPMERKSRWACRLSRGDFVACVELVPPKGIDSAKIVENAQALKAAGIDAVNVPDSPRAQVKMGALLASVLLQQASGIEAIPHYTCKDKNLLALQADLLGAHALGIRNVLAVTGDPPNIGTYPDATAVFNIDSIGLSRLMNMLNHGSDLGNNPIGTATEFCIGVALNPNAVNLERERERMKLKIEAGAEFAITQPVFDADSLLRFLDGMRGSRMIPVVAGIWPLVSQRNAEFLKNEVPGVSVPDAVVSRMARCDTKESALEEGITIARELLSSLRGAIAGVQVSAPLGRIQSALKVIRG
ncbi:MAG TPA: bifunctional homocysteine S-methyltransferase/methylenetetrahydrofolate reductase [Spirochaetia bacterium]|nr:bifunctional homocysteine S-methyltransferase/methylenetetrahydrofolate reductase [Spirochaetia bacterium]